MIEVMSHIIILGCISSLVFLVAKARAVSALMSYMIGVVFFCVIPTYYILLNGGYAYYGRHIYYFYSPINGFVVSVISYLIALMVYIYIGSYGSSAARVFESRSIARYRLWILVFLCVLPVIVYYALLGEVPFYAALRELASSGMSITLMNKYRLKQTAYLGGEGAYFGQGYFFDWFTNIIPFIIIFVIHTFELSRRSKIILYSLPLLIQISTGKRWPLFVVILYYIVFYINNNGQKMSRQLTRPKVLMGAMSGLLVVGVLSFLQARFNPADSVVENIQTALTEYLSRFSLLSGVALNTSIKYFSEDHAMRLGSTWLQDLQAILPGPGNPFSVEFFYLQNGVYGFTASPTLLGSFFVNFGYTGIVIGGLVFSMMLAGIDRLLMNSDDLAKRIFYAFMVVTTFVTVQGDLITFVNISIELLVAMILCRFVVARLDSRSQSLTVGNRAVFS